MEAWSKWGVSGGRQGRLHERKVAIKDGECRDAGPMATDNGMLMAWGWGSMGENRAHM